MQICFKDIRRIFGALVFLSFLTLSRSACGAEHPSDAPPAHFPNAKINVINYDVELTIPSIDAPVLQAVAELKIDFVSQQGKLDLHTDAKRTFVKSVSVDGAAANFTVISRDRNQYNLSGDILRIDLAAAADAGETRLVRISYGIAVNHPDERRSKRNTQQAWFYEPAYYGAAVLSTRNWPYYARSWLPSNDHPSNPASVTFTLNVPPDLTAVANGELISSAEMPAPSANGLITYRWRQKQPIPTYSFSVVIGAFEKQSVEDCYNTEPPNTVIVDCSATTRQMLASLYFAKSVPDPRRYFAAFNHAQRAMIWLSGVLGNYRFDKLSFVTAPHPFNMEYASLITLVDPSSSVHEVAHQWWGNGVHIKHWGDLWISEGFATYFVELYAEEIFGKAYSSCRSSEGILNRPDDTDPMVSFDRVPYCKGAAALHAIRQIIAGHIAPDKRDELTRPVLLALFRSTYESYEGRALTTAEFYAHVRASLPRTFAKHGLTVDDSELLKSLDAWKTTWFAPF